ncbi:hypothetical protein BV911_02135 [Pseudoruegeria sp. SK021]|nr:hypothetical protein BV911_02135 [Pseudoruegeria sp. SK021]
MAGLGASGQFAKISVIFPMVQAAYPGSGASLGFVVSALSLLGVGLGLVAGLIAVQIGYRRMLLGGLMLGAAMSLLQSLMLPLPVMLVSRVVEGLSHLAIIVAAPTLIAEVTALRHRPAAMTLWSTFFAVSFAAVAVLGVPLARAYGPGAVFAAHGLYMLVIAALLSGRLPRRSRTADRQPLRLATVLARHVQVYRSPFVAAPAIGWLFYTLAFVSLLTVLPGFFAAEIQSLAAGTLPLASIAISMTVGVALMRMVPPIHVVVLGFGLALAAVIAMAIWPGVLWPCVALMGALGLVQGASFAAVPQLNPSAEARALGNGAMAQTGNLGNTLGTPVVLLAIEAFGYGGLIGFAAACFGAGIAVHLLLMRARRRA